MTRAAQRQPLASIGFSRSSHRAGTIAALAAGIAVLGCTPLAAPDALCPPGKGPAAGVSQPQQVSESGENHPVAIAVAGTTIFWIDAGPPEMNSAEGNVTAVDLCTRTERVLATGRSRPSALAVDAGTIYWVNAGLGNKMGSLCYVPASGTDSEVRCPLTGEARPSSIAVDGGAVYFTAEGDLDGNLVFMPGTGSLRRYDIATGTATTLVAGLDAPTAVSAIAGEVAFATAGQGALVDVDGLGMKVPTFAENTGAVERLSGGQRSTVATMSNAPIAVVLAPPHVLWLERGVKRGTGRLLREDAVVANSLDYPGAFALDGDDAYVAVTGADDEIMEGRVSRHRLGAAEFTLAASQQLPKGIAVDRHLLYWVDSGRNDMLDGQALVRWKNP